jgi:hypothetical protein
MPSYDLGILITLTLGLTLMGIVATGMFAWAIVRQRILSTREIAQIQREVAFMIRRQYGDMDRDLQEMKDLVGGR